MGGGGHGFAIGVLKCLRPAILIVSPVGLVRETAVAGGRLGWRRGFSLIWLVKENASDGLKSFSMTVSAWSVRGTGLTWVGGLMKGERWPNHCRSTVAIIVPVDVRQLE